MEVALALFKMDFKAYSTFFCAFSLESPAALAMSSTSLIEVNESPFWPDLSSFHLNYSALNSLIQSFPMAFWRAVRRLLLGLLIP